MTRVITPELHEYHPRSERDPSLGRIRVTMKGNAAVCEWVPKVSPYLYLEPEITFRLNLQGLIARTVQ